MMFVISIYGATGEILRHAEGAELDLLLLNVGEDEGWLPGYYDGDAFVAKDGLPVQMPPRPSGSAPWVFDRQAGDWIDPRTPADLQAALYAARNATVLDKSDLLTRMFLAGLFDADNVLIASQGEIPPSLEPALQSMPAEAQVIARIKWRSDTVISRVNPVIVLAAAALGVTDEQMDAIFGVTVPA